MAATNVQAFSGDVEISSNLTAPFITGLGYVATRTHTFNPTGNTSKYFLGWTTEEGMEIEINDNGFSHGSTQRFYITYSYDQTPYLSSADVSDDKVYNFYYTKKNGRVYIWFNETRDSSGNNVNYTIRMKTLKNAINLTEPGAAETYEGTVIGVNNVSAFPAPILFKREGYVGIGTTNPISRLNITQDFSGSGPGVPVANVVADDGGLQFGLYVGEKTASPFSRTCLRAVDDDETVFIVDGWNKRVGIGMTNPGDNLSVMGVISAQNNTTSTPQYLFRSGPSNTNSWQMKANISDAYAGDFSIDRLDASTPAKFVIKNNGNVGIGTDPTARFHIHGNDDTQPTFYSYSRDTGNNSYNSEILQRGINFNENDPLFLFKMSEYTETYNRAGFEIRGKADSTFFSVRQNGNVGIRATSPNATLEVVGPSIQSQPVNTKQVISRFSTGDGVLNIFSLQMGYGAERIGLQTTIDGQTFEAEVSDGFTYADNSRHNLLLQPYRGYVGIGTTTPNVPLRIDGGSNPAFISQWLNYMTNYNINTTRQYENFPDNYLPGNAVIGMYSTHAIGTQTYVFSQGGGLTGSDIRIKKDIAEIDDGAALGMLRLLEPKQYKYKDTFARGEDPVWGFIAQEVANVIPYSVRLETEYIPNIMEVVQVSNSNIITFSNFDTSNLESNATSLRLTDYDGATHDVKIKEILNDTSIRVDEDLTPYLRSLDETGNLVIETTTTVITPEEYNNLTDSEKKEYKEDSDTYVKTSNTYIGNEIFAFGQEVNNFNFLKKESIFTIATAALQEVDRHQQADKVRITNLETQLTSVLARLDALESA